jgi:hypothetical protein
MIIEDFVLKEFKNSGVKINLEASMTGLSIGTQLKKLNLNKFTYLFVRNIISNRVRMFDYKQQIDRLFYNSKQCSTNL